MGIWDDIVSHHYQPTVRSIARRMSASQRQAEDAEDVVQDAICSILAGGLPPTPALLMTASRRQLIEHYRRQSAAKRQVRTEWVGSLDGLPGRPRDPAELLTVEERLSGLCAGRPAEEAEILRLHAAGATTADLARLSGWGERRIQRLLARVRLRGGLDK